MRVRVASVKDLDRFGRLVACVDGVSILLMRMDDRLIAVPAACPHLGYSLKDATLVGRYVLECPIHRWRFDVRTGAPPRHWWTPVESRRSQRRLKRLPVEVIDGEIFVGAPAANEQR